MGNQTRLSLEREKRWFCVLGLKWCLDRCPCPNSACGRGWSPFSGKELETSYDPPFALASYKTICCWNLILVQETEIPKSNWRGKLMTMCCCESDWSICVSIHLFFFSPSVTILLQAAMAPCSSRSTNYPVFPPSVLTACLLAAFDLSQVLTTLYLSSASAAQQFCETLRALLRLS